MVYGFLDQIRVLQLSENFLSWYQVIQLKLFCFIKDALKSRFSLWGARARNIANNAEQPATNTPLKLHTKSLLQFLYLYIMIWFNQGSILGQPRRRWLLYFNSGFFSNKKTVGFWTEILLMQIGHLGWYNNNGLLFFTNFLKFYRAFIFCPIACFGPYIRSYIYWTIFLTIFFMLHFYTLLTAKKPYHSKIKFFQSFLWFKN